MHSDPLPPWWSGDLIAHPMAAPLLLEPQDRWQPRPVPPIQVERRAGSVSVTWLLDGETGPDVEVEVIGDMLVLSATTEDGRRVSRAVALPDDADLSHRRERWSTTDVQVIVPRYTGSLWTRVRGWMSIWTHRLADWLRP